MYDTVENEDKSGKNTKITANSDPSVTLNALINK